MLKVIDQPWHHNKNVFMKFQDWLTMMIRVCTLATGWSRYNGDRNTIVESWTIYIACACSDTLRQFLFLFGRTPCKLIRGCSNMCNIAEDEEAENALASVRFAWFAYTYTYKYVVRAPVTRWVRPTQPSTPLAVDG